MKCSTGVRSLVFLFSVGLVMLLALVGSAGATPYYVKNGGSDTESGLSDSEAWATLGRVSQQYYNPGDTINLKRGSTWNEELTLNGVQNGNGNSGAYITVQAYGTNANQPKIQRSGADICVNISNCQYWHISDLELCYAGAAIMAHYTLSNSQGLKISKLKIHDCTNSIQIATDQTGPAFLQKVELDNVEVGYCSIGNLIYQCVAGQPGIPLEQYTTELDRTITDVVVKNCYTHDLDYNEGFINVNNMTYMDNRIERVAYLYYEYGATGMMLSNDTNLKFINNTFKHVYDSDSADMSFIDSECWNGGPDINEGFKFFGNYFTEAAGPALEFLQHIEARLNDYNRNHVIAGNTFVGNSWAPTYPQRGGIALYKMKNNGEPYSGTVGNNLWNDPYGLMVYTGSYYGNWTDEGNNINIPDPNTINNAAMKFSGTQGGANDWYYEYFDGSNWSQLTHYDSVKEQWDNSSTYYVSRFNMFPAPDTTSLTKWVSRTWEAPASGNVSIRGRVLKNVLGGNGAQVRIVKHPAGGGSEVLWGPTVIGANDRIGVDTFLDEPVETGDLIRFEVNDNSTSGSETTNDRISWVPTLAYTSQGEPDTTVTFVNIANDGDPINGWHDNASPNGINYGSGQFWAWDGSTYGLSTGKAASTGYEDTRHIILPADKRLKKVDIGHCGGTLGTVTFSNGTPSEDRVVDLATCPRTNYDLNWSDTTPDVYITVTVTDKTCAWSVVFDNFVFGDVGGGGGSWQASLGFSSAVPQTGENQWWYQYFDGSYHNMTTYNTEYEGWLYGNNCFVGNNWQHPDYIGGAIDSVRTWEAPYDGTISIQGTASLQETSGTNGVQVTIKQNNTAIGEGTFTLTNDPGPNSHYWNFTTPVTAGDEIQFIVNCNGTDCSSDTTIWDPTIA